MDMSKKDGKKPGKLGKLKMPMKRGNEMDASDLMDEEALESPNDEAAESPEEQGMEQEMGTESPVHMDTISDEELLAEIRKRGLESQLHEGDSGDSKEMDLGSGV